MRGLMIFSVVAAAAVGVVATQLPVEIETTDVPERTPEYLVSACSVTTSSSDNWLGLQLYNVTHTSFDRICASTEIRAEMARQSACAAADGVEPTSLGLAARVYCPDQRVDEARAEVAKQIICAEEQGQKDFSVRRAAELGYCP